MDLFVADGAAAYSPADELSSRCRAPTDITLTSDTALMIGKMASRNDRWTSLEQLLYSYPFQKGQA
jgi:hypothetical protein